MFYSAIVGSIPGQLQTAKEVLDVFVNYLRSSLHDVVVINPAEHFEEGMDAGRCHVHVGNFSALRRN